MRLDPILNAHAFMKLERPPELWDADAEDVTFVPLLGEAIAAALAGGAPLGALTLSASNIVVAPSEDDDAPAAPPPGEYVGVTIRAPTDLGPDDTWPPASPGRRGLLLRLHERLEAAGARFAYVRRIPPGGTLTVFLPRLKPSGNPPDSCTTRI